MKVIFLTAVIWIRVRRWLFRRKIKRELRAVAHEARLALRGVENPYMPDSWILSSLIKVRVRWEYSHLPHPAAVLLFIMALLFYFWKVMP